jgi:hypothetical protein
LASCEVVVALALTLRLPGSAAAGGGALVAC